VGALVLVLARVRGLMGERGIVGVFVMEEMIRGVLVEKRQVREG